MVCTHKTVVILGAGPVGLFSAFKILESNFAQNILILEKRLTSSQKFEEWGERSMVVQFHRKFLFSDFPEMTDVCPHGVLKEKNESNRLKYNDLDNMSIKNIQSTLLEKIDKHYRDRFFIMKIDSLRYDTGIVSIIIDDDNSQDLLDLNPDFIVDATGYHSVLMNKIIGVDFEKEYEYGSALKITWPEHEFNTIKDKEVEFHD